MICKLLVRVGIPGLMLLGAVPATAQDLVWSVQGSAPRDMFGKAVASAGDIDGDGTLDLAIGIPGSDVIAADAGEVRIYSGLTGTLLRTLYGSSAGDFFGGSLAGVGDVDGDLVPDLLVGATTDKKPGLPHGGQYVRVHSGADGSVIHHLTSPVPSATRFGLSVNRAGDIDADGRQDFIVGAPDFEPDCPWGWWCQGAAFVFSGASAAVLYSIVTPPSIEKTPGWDVTGGEDLDGDGKPDWVVGDPDYYGEGSFYGEVRIYKGSDGTLIRSHNHNALNNSRFGRVVEFGGDVDADGVADLVVCEGEYEYGSLASLRTYVYSGATGATLHVIGESYNSAAAIGDLTQDGKADLLLGHSYKNFLVVRSGQNARAVLGVLGLASGDALGASVAGMGDLDLDTYPDFAVGAPQSGNDPGYVLVVKGFQDCDGNGQQDALQLAQGTLPDCNDNGIPDLCDISGGTAEDCNSNLVPDSCEYSAATDCNTNGILDACDILSGTSDDFDGNGVPDECECSWNTYCVAAPNTFGPGANIGWSGSFSVAQNQLQLEVTGAPPTQPGIFFFGLNQTQTPFGEGFLCVTGGQERLLPVVFVGATGFGSYTVDFTDPSSPAFFLQPGDVRNFQFWYRDPQLVGYGFNLSDGLHVTLCP